MITINLKPGAKRQAPKGDAFAALRERFRGAGKLVKEPGLLIAGVAWAAVIIVVGGLYLHAQNQVHTLEPRLQQSKDEFARYETFVREKRHEEKIRDSILAQIGTISSVDQDRYTWSHILDEVANAVPEFTWLTTVAAAAPVTATSATVVTDTTVAPPVSVLISGETNDLENYTAFLRRLGDSHWLINVLPVKTETIIDHDNRPITSFTVQATFARADSSRIQMVPILESTVR